MFPNCDEGRLTQLRHQLVNNETLAGISKALGLGSVLRLGRGEEASGGRNRDKNLANSFEALLGALYRDQGYSAVMFVVQCQFAKKAISHVDRKPEKQILHEWAQKTHGVVPLYSLVEERGLAHELSFVMSVTVDGQAVAVGTGNSKKKASKEAAKRAVVKLGLK